MYYQWHKLHRSNRPIQNRIENIPFELWYLTMGNPVAASSDISICGRRGADYYLPTEQSFILKGAEPIPQKNLTLLDDQPTGYTAKPISISNPVRK